MGTSKMLALASDDDQTVLEINNQSIKIMITSETLVLARIYL